MLDYGKLCEPYRENGRTPELQRKWLVEKKRIPEDVADLALSTVYARIDQGETFASGDALDQALLAEARELVRSRVEAALRVGQEQIEGAATALYRQRTAARKPKNLLRHPLVAAKWYKAQLIAFVLGTAIVGAAWIFWG